MRILIPVFFALGLGAGLPATAQSQELAQQAALSPDAIAAVTRAENYLNKLGSLKARFVQLSSNGAYAEGEVIVKRPGNMRFDYDAPHPALLISNGVTLLYYDRDLKQATFLPLWETPLWFLIREKVELGDDLRATKVEEGLGVISITLEDRENPDRGQVTLIFSDAPMALKKWEVLDEQGIKTEVALIDALYDTAIDDDVFDYDDLEIHKAGQDRINK